MAGIQLVGPRNASPHCLLFLDTQFWAGKTRKLQSIALEQVVARVLAFGEF
jgi:hypothetical protein